MLEGMKQLRAICKSPVSASVSDLRPEIDTFLAVEFW